MDINKLRSDEACKKILADKELLAFILKGLIPEYHDSSIKDIKEKYIQGNVIDTVGTEPVVPDVTDSLENSGVGVEGKNVRYDLKFDTLLPEPEDGHVKFIINLEAQKETSSLSYRPVTRGIFYASNLITSEYGSVFKNSRYEKIEKVYSIWICMSPNKEEKGRVNRYRLKEDHMSGNLKENPIDYDKIEIIVIHIGEIEDEDRIDYNLSKMTKMLTEAFSNDKPTAEVISNLERLGLNLSNTLKEDIENMCSFSDVYEERAITETKKDNALRMIAGGKLSYEEIATYTDLPLETVKKLAEKKTA